MSDSLTSSLTSVTSALAVAFDAGQLTSDGGLVWLARADDRLGLSAALAAQICEWRRGPVRHPLALLLRQRILQIACGYEDQDDADTLRHDPLLKLVCGRRPHTPSADLASQPTLSRLENAVDRRACYRLAQTLVGIYLQERERAQEAGGAPTRLLLDLDGTDDPTHGEQEGSAYHGYYQQHMYHPLLIYDGHTNQLITAVLRPGTAHASRGVVSILRRLVAALRARWPHVTIELRADSGFAVPALYDYCEREGIAYTIGLAPNTRLQALAAPLVAEAARQHEHSGEKVRLAGEGQYAADSWSHPRRVVDKAEELAKGSNLRFVVTTRTDLEPLALYNWYVRRGEPELWIKDLKDACFADRLSCHRFWANQFRLLLHAAA
jgi:Transposase DDE domain group 1